ncbi:MAG TPA: radical SAM protein [Polyangia bacterium]|nr:radical SAM protein [Polyangia bacterium]
MRVLLVQPAPFEPGRLGLENVIWLSEPVALTSIAAMIPEHEVRLLDMRLEPDTALNELLLGWRPELVGVTSMTTDCYQARAVLEVAKGTLGDACFTLVGGHHPTLSPEDFEDDTVDAICLGEGEETFQQLVAHLAAGGDRRALGAIAGLRHRTADGWATTPKRAQSRTLDSFPAPARHLIPARYRREYFFTVAGPMASMQTSRGCSFDCNFCAIWEFYERRTRYLSAEAICDRLETIEEKFVFLLDDNFLTNKKRLEALCDELERRGIQKYFGTQGRTDFIAENPALMARLAKNGLMMVLSGYESNDDDALEALRKKSTRDANRRAADVLRDLGIISTGIFMVRPDFEEADFDRLYAAINELGIAIPLVTVLTPLPGTQLFKQRQHELLTRDVRLFDLLHAVLPTKIPRARFYAKMAEYNRATWPGFERAIRASVRRRPGFFLGALPGIARFLRRANRYRPVVESGESHLRDEVGIIDANITAATAPARRKLPVVGDGASVGAP